MNAITKPAPPPSDNSIQSLQRREAARVNAHLDRGGRVWFDLTAPREVERAVAVGVSLYFAFVDGTDAICGHFGSMSDGYSLWFEARKKEAVL